MKDKKLISGLREIITFSGDKERQVEAIYNTLFKDSFEGIRISNPFKCDGYFETTINDNKTSIICEYKYDTDLKNNVSRARVICQVLFYLKKFEDTGKALPNIVFVGDVNECFVVHTNNIAKYLDFEGVDWTVAPSLASTANIGLLTAISEDDAISPFVFDIDETFTCESVIQKIQDLASNVVRLVRITEHNVDKVFAYFKKAIKNSKKMSSKELVSVFLGSITNHDEYYKHPTKKNTLVTPKGNVNIDGGKFDAFFSYFQKSYTPQEITKFTEIADRLIEDIERRNSGDFWTPTLFCDYAHKMIGEELGEDWKEKYVVWDCACGTKNLTRDYKFLNLYCSTLFDSELEISKQYNKEATTFQFDFLNDPEDKLPESLIEHFKNNDPIMFFINPPYGRVSAVGGVEAGQTNTKINEEMKKDKLDGSEFIKQFLYRITKIKEAYNLTNVSVCCFTKPSWLIKPWSESFRKLWFKNFKFENGIMFCASEFADCSSNWGITFNIWTSEEQEEKNNFVHTLVQKNEENEIVSIGEKTLYNFDGQDIVTTCEYINKPNKGKKKTEKELIHCTDIVKMEFEKVKEKVYDDFIFYGNKLNNDPQTNNAAHFSSKIGANMMNITKSNLLEASVVLALKTLIQTNWVIDKDQYNMNVDIPNQFKLDCLVYSTFMNYCMAYNLDGDRLKNEFFWMSKQEMEDLANTYSNQECYNDVHTDSDRYVYKYLEEHYDELSDDAKDILESARELARKSFKYREMFNEEEPKYQINNWDAGWYQVKGLLKAYMPNELKEFNALYKAFGNRLRPLVYELGFLKKQLGREDQEAGL